MARKSADVDSETPEEREINRKAWRVSIEKGAASAYRALQDFQIPRLLDVVKDLDSNRKPPPGTTPGAWKKAAKKSISPGKLFAFPEDLISNPRLIGYYRRLAGASLKAVRNAIADPMPFETGRRDKLGKELALSFAELFNTSVSLLIETEETFDEIDIPAMVGATAGTQIQGTAVSGKGQIAQEMIWSWIVELLHAGGYVSAFSTRKGSRVVRPLKNGQLPGSSDLRSVRLKNGMLLSYANDPDIAIHDSNDLLRAVHEVKAGIDKAGVGQRYPAAQASFQAAKKLNPACHTVLVIGVLSSAVKRKMRTDGTVDNWYLLPELEMDAEKRTEYLMREIQSYAER